MYVNQTDHKTSAGRPHTPAASSSKRPPHHPFSTMMCEWPRPVAAKFSCDQLPIRTELSPVGSVHCR